MGDRVMYEKESKAVSYFLRHGKEKEKLNINSEGFMNCDELIEVMQKNKFPNFSFEILQQIVREDEKGRYSFNDADIQSMIRANQGHSIDVENLKLDKKIPPVTLYHGTSDRGFKGIQKTGIQRMKRNHVHLTDDIATATSVGMRHGSEIIIAIDTRDMVKDKLDFFRSENGVWLTNFVDIKYFKEIIRK
jgi:putative RNA 2'-phosphotransferase